MSKLLAAGIFIVFLYLKLSGQGVVATWSWWWVASPIWIYAIVFALMFIAMFLIDIYPDIKESVTGRSRVVREFINQKRREERSSKPSLLFRIINYLK